MALRSHDIRSLQVSLGDIGLSSLGRTEFNVLASVDAVLELLHQWVNKSMNSSLMELPAFEIKDGEQLLKEHTEALLGYLPANRRTRIMVTMPCEAADDYMLVYDLLKSGMNCMRINCAHDNVYVWEKIIKNLRKAEKDTKLSCKIIMDIAGPKLRTGSIELKPAVIKIRPLRNEYGEVLRPASVWMTVKESPKLGQIQADFCIPLEKDFLVQLEKEDHIKLHDSHKGVRILKVVKVTPDGCLAEISKTAYIMQGTVLVVKSERFNDKEIKTTVGSLPEKENTIHLTIGDMLILDKKLDYGRPAILNENGKVVNPAVIGFHFPGKFQDIKAGESILFDDGKIGGVVDKVEEYKLYVRIIQTRAGGQKLGSEKGINLPDSNLHLSAMTDKDVEDLKFIAGNADIVALSFVNSVKDVQLLRKHLNRLGKVQLAIVLKIETQKGFKNLPSLLLEIMKAPCCGVMIARGDLAVECGFERMAEVQEEILWVCEAAHIPVIWATQVLESMVKEGTPSRSEISDAAMGVGAECVMLNKGKYIIDAVKALNDILKRMQEHKIKKFSIMRKLKLAITFREKNF
jgi:pyruvate kinase